MSGSAREWLIVVAFFVGLFSFTFAEAAWMSKRISGGFPRAILFSFSSNLLSVIIGFFVAAVVVGVIFAMAWDGSLQTVPVNDAGTIGALVFAAIFPVVLLVALKILFLRLLRINEIGTPLAYSLVASMLFFVSTIGLSVAVGFILFSY